MLLLQLTYLYSGKATKISCKRIRTVRMACVFIVESLTAAVIMWVTWYDLKRMSSCSMGMLLLNKMFTFLWLCCDANRLLIVSLIAVVGLHAQLAVFLPSR